MRHIVSIFDITADEIHRIFDISCELKAKLAEGVREPLFPGRVVALLFEKPSLRTRVSFETAIAHLGGNSMFLGADVGWGSRESSEDFARTLSEYVDVIVCRSKAHDRVVELASHSQKPVVNGLTDTAHPCQALADLFTLQETWGGLKDRKLAYIGDANNVARSLALTCAKLGVAFAIASPSGYELDEAFIAAIRSSIPTAEIELVQDPSEAVKEAGAVYTDVWASMGQEAEQDKRKTAFAKHQVNAELMSRAPKDACFLHCLPARRGEEATSDVIDGPQSIVMQQAANRLHAQKGLLAWLLGLMDVK